MEQVLLGADYYLNGKVKLIFYGLIGLLFVLQGCERNSNQKQNHNTIVSPVKIPKDSIRFSNGFDFPVGKPDAKEYYNAQKFKENNHLGEDWNGKGGGNTDLGDPIYSISNGYVSYADNVGGGWGNVIRVVHYLNDEEMIESLYAHCDTILVEEGDFVSKGQQIGTIGNNNGQYLAHLHFELRDKVGMPIGEGYSKNTEGYMDPTPFIRSHRK